MSITRLPATPIITTDPYISLWSNTDKPNRGDVRHWAGERKRIEIKAIVNGEYYRLLGLGNGIEAEVEKSTITPTTTTFGYKIGEVEIELSFAAPLLLDDMDLMSMPVTFIDAKAVAKKETNVKIELIVHDDICYNGTEVKPVYGDVIEKGELNIALMGRRRQDLLSHSCDHSTIDWGYAYVAATGETSVERIGSHYGIISSIEKNVKEEQNFNFIFAYDDIVSINYFGHMAKAWYTRNGMTIVEAVKYCANNRENIINRLNEFDVKLMADAKKVGKDAYVSLICASYRQSICAHKLIADKDGNAVFLSKENDSNGCIGTVDVSYPSIPLYLIYNPEFVRAMSRQILHFANLPVWKFNYAPHDVGQYPHATGQVYSLKGFNSNQEKFDGWGEYDVELPLYLYDDKNDLYHERWQMPVEECGNMILMLAAALKADGDTTLVSKYKHTLKLWVQYLIDNGADPGEQLCTDDFAGHLAHNVNLAFKAVCGIAGYAYILEILGDKEEAKRAMESAKKMAISVSEKANQGDHYALTLAGDGWSLKYNTIWDSIFGFNLLPCEFYKTEIAYYKKMLNEYGVPLDNRADYTKSDWTMWAAALSNNVDDVEMFAKPIEKFLRESNSRVAFSDWYNTKSGNYEHFIARSVQGGIFMPLLKSIWENK